MTAVAGRESRGWRVGRSRSEARGANLIARSGRDSHPARHRCPCEGGKRPARRIRRSGSSCQVRALPARQSLAAAGRSTKRQQLHRDRLDDSGRDACIHDRWLERTVAKGGSTGDRNFRSQISRGDLGEFGGPFGGRLRRADRRRRAGDLGSTDGRKHNGGSATDRRAGRRASRMSAGCRGVAMRLRGIPGYGHERLAGVPGGGGRMRSGGMCSGRVRGRRRSGLRGQHLTETGGAVGRRACGGRGRSGGTRRETGGETRKKWKGGELHGTRTLLGPKPRADPWRRQKRSVKMSRPPFSPSSGGFSRTGRPLAVKAVCRPCRWSCSSLRKWVRRCRASSRTGSSSR